MEGPELHVGEGLCERQTGETAQQRRERDLHLHPCQRRAETVVYAVAEREVAGSAAVHIECVGSVDEVRVAVARGQGHEDELTGGDGAPGDFSRGGGRAPPSISPSVVVIRGMPLCTIDSHLSSSSTAVPTASGSSRTAAS